jgi:hypothetical protein
MFFDRMPADHPGDGAVHRGTSGGKAMTVIRMTGDVRTDMDCEAKGLPAERWAETVLKIGDDELVMEVSIEDKVIVALMAGEDAVWKGTLDGLKMLLRGEIKGRQKTER